MAANHARRSIARIITLTQSVSRINDELRVKRKERAERTDLPRVTSALVPSIRGKPKHRRFLSSQYPNPDTATATSAV